MESLGIVQTHVIYESEEFFFYKNEFVGTDGITRFFYCVGNNYGTHNLSNSEGEILNYIVDEAFKKFDSDGIEIALIDFSSGFQKERMQ
ncbi:MAG: hypothetical protein WCT07_01640 [Candidatus Paceibacterota bacterium]|jgi:hypothetical protein